MPINLFEYEKLATNCLSQMVLDYYASGAWDEVTLRENRAAFERVKLRPRMLVDVSQRNLSTQVLGQPLQIPLLIAPMAFQCLAHAEGELATAKAAAQVGAGMILSTCSTQSLEAVATVAASGSPSPLWFQLYIHRDRALTQELVERAYATGYQALCITVDAPMLGRRERDQRNQFTLPPGMTMANLKNRLPEVEGESGLFTYFAQQLDASLTWADLEWVQSLSPLPVVVKGILRGDDAVRAVNCGVKGIVVSNHGGRQLDGAIASLEALPEVVEAVEGRAEVLVDGGIRRGRDVLAAIALGAKAILLGRPVLWGLAVAGEAGVVDVLSLLRDEFDLAMALSGCRTVQDIESSLLS
ncbi:MAG: alpha-hydroxy acid oxidase [Microcoleaceae cyanobacterium]